MTKLRNKTRDKERIILEMMLESVLTTCLHTCTWVVPGRKVVLVLVRVLAVEVRRCCPTTSY